MDDVAMFGEVWQRSKRTFLPSPYRGAKSYKGIAIPQVEHGCEGSRKCYVCKLARSQIDQQLKREAAMKGEVK